MGVNQYENLCPNCGKMMQCFLETKMPDSPCGECLHCGFYYLTASGFMGLDQLNERRKEGDMLDIDWKKLPKQNEKLIWRDHNAVPIDQLKNLDSTNAKFILRSGLSSSWFFEMERGFLVVDYIPESWPDIVVSYGYIDDKERAFQRIAEMTEEEEWRLERGEIPKKFLKK